jgi:hypothetical protein
MSMKSPFAYEPTYIQSKYLRVGIICIICYFLTAINN